jgi:hypothetical protein
MKYLLLTPLTLDQLQVDNWDDMYEALEEFGCKYLESEDALGNKVVFATATSKETLVNMTQIVDLPGIAVEFTNVFDQAVIL